MQKENIKSEMKLLASFNVYLWENGGVSACPDVFEKALNTRSAILQHFGLPEYHDYLELLDFHKIPSSYRIAKIEKQLNQYARKYLLSPVQSSTDFLKQAKDNTIRPTDALAELKIIPHDYTLFVYQKIIRKNKDSAANSLKAMEYVQNNNLLNDIGIVTYYDKKSKERKQSLLKLNSFQIPYMKQYLSYIRRQNTKTFSPINITSHENPLEVPF